jgi:putative phage-type endonuclease
MQQGTQEWLDFRKTKIGASDAPIIMGVSPWSDPIKLWEQKVGISENEDSSYWMRRGLTMEDDAREYFHLVTGRFVEPAVFVSNRHDWMMASLDGLSPDQTTLVEIKCPGPHDHSIALDGRIPEKYYPQIQHQLEVLELDGGYYLSFDGENNVIIPFERDQKYIDYLLEKEFEFYKCVQNFQPPAPPNQIEDPLWEPAALQLKSITKQMKELERQEKTLRNTLLGLSNGKMCEGNGVKVTKIIRKGSINYDKILNDYGIQVNLEDYRGDSVESWKITIQ